MLKVTVVVVAVPEVRPLAVAQAPAVGVVDAPVYMLTQTCAEPVNEGVHATVAD